MSHADRPDPETVVLKNGTLAATPQQILSALDEHSIEHYTVVHKPLYTVEEARSVNYEVEGAHTKNLFLRNKKGRMFLLVLERDQQINLRELRDKLGVPGGQFAFASTERMAQYLGVVPGSVSSLAVFNDHEGAVQVLMQSVLADYEWIYVHPCRNTHSTRIRANDLLKLLALWQHPVTLMDFS